MSVSNNLKRETITPDEEDTLDDISKLADLNLDIFNFQYAIHGNPDTPKGSLGHEEVNEHQDGLGIENKTLAAEEIESIPNLKDSVAVANQINDEIHNSTNSLVITDEFKAGEYGSTGIGHNLDNSIIVGNFRNTEGGRIDYGPFMRSSENSTWVGDVNTWPVFHKATDNLLFGNIGEEDNPVNSVFDKSHRNIIVGDEIYAEDIGNGGINLVVADNIEANNISSNTIVLEGDDFQGDKEELAEYLHNNTNKRLSAFHAFNLDGPYEDLEEFDQQMSNVNEMWSEVSEDYRKLNAVAREIPVPEPKGSNQDIYERLKRFEANFDNIEQTRTGYLVKDKDTIAIRDFFEGKNIIRFGDEENNFKFEYDEEEEGFTEILSTIDDSIEEEIRFFDFDGGESPEDLLNEIEQVKEKSSRIKEDYEDPITLFENLDIERFQSTGDIKERLNGFDEEIKQKSKTKWHLSDDSAELMVEKDPSKLIDSIPEHLRLRCADNASKDDNSADHYLRLANGFYDSNEQIELESEDLENIHSSMWGLFKTEMDLGYKAQIFNQVINEIPEEADERRDKVGGFIDKINQMDEEYREELFDRLKTEKDRLVVEEGENEHGEVKYSSGDDKFGNTIVDLAKNRRYEFFLGRDPDGTRIAVENESSMDIEIEEIQELLDLEGEMPEIDEWFQNLHENKIEDLFDEYEEEIRKVTALAERLELEYDPTEPIKNKTKGEWEKELEKDLNKKLRSYTKQTIEKLGKDKALDEYEKSTGKRPDNITENELDALKIKNKDKNKHNRGIQNTVDRLLELNDNEEGIYEQGENQEWLGTKKFTAEDLMEPDLKERVKNDERYSPATGYDDRSALKVKVEEENIKEDFEGEKEKYWGEILEDLENLGVKEELENPDQHDIDQVKEIKSELEPEEVNQRDYQELEEDIEEYKTEEGKAKSTPDELAFYTSNPMLITQMGNAYDISCHGIEKSNGWAAISNALDANKMVFYAEDPEKPGKDVARVKAFITEDNELVYHNTDYYDNTNIQVSEYFEGYMEKVAEELNLELKHSNNAENYPESVETLEAHDWYKRR